MNAKTPKRPRDSNQLAKRIVDIATGEEPEETLPPETDEARLGRTGGLKGGPARARKLSSKKRSEIAKKAAKARWEKSDA